MEKEDEQRSSGKEEKEEKKLLKEEKEDFCLFEEEEEDGAGTLMKCSYRDDEIFSLHIFF